MSVVAKVGQPYKYNKRMETTKKKRPVGMTVLLILSLINACLNILSSMIAVIMKPQMTEMFNNGQFEEMTHSFPFLSGDFAKAANESLHFFIQTDSKFYLILMVLFIASLIGVIRMFRSDKSGFHIYAIAQICMLIDNSMFVYPLQKPSPFISDLTFTGMFILLYYLYFKRMELSEKTQNPE